MDRSAPLRSIKTRISTLDLETTQAFYESVLGLEVLEAWNDPGDHGVILGLPGASREAMLEIVEGDATSGFEGLSLQFRVASLEKFVDRLDASIPANGPVERPWGSTYLYLTDPNGISVIVYDGGF